MLNANKVPIGDYFRDFQELVGRKRSAHRSVLDAILSELQVRFETFERNRAKLELVPRAERTEEQCAALQSCYDDGAKFLRDLLVLLDYVDDGQPARLCPYCQLFPVGAWDHFLPSALFPDFYVHPLNLVRACKHCNEEKGARRVVPVRETIHPYFDPLHVQYLKCVVSYDEDFAVDFKIAPDMQNPDYDPYVHSVVQRHFETYGLGRKFRAEASRKIADFKTNMAKILEERAITEEDVDREIRHEIKKLIRQGEVVNSWQLAFWEGMRECAVLVQIANTDQTIIAVAAS